MPAGPILDTQQAFENEQVKRCPWPAGEAQALGDLKLTRPRREPRTDAALDPLGGPGARRAHRRDPPELGYPDAEIATLRRTRAV